jgi:hypothetical protein
VEVFGEAGQNPPSAEGGEQAVDEGAATATESQAGSEVAGETSEGEGPSADSEQSRGASQDSS